jgi:hypothetical protein
MRLLSAFLLGAIFGLGLILADMTDPARILAFLDIAGDWNPSLALVMISAIAVAFPAFAWARRRPVSLLGESIGLPERRKITWRLVLGAAIFGLGWGLAGICPGPGVVLLGQDGASSLVFVATVIAGTVVGSALESLGRSTTPPSR